MNADQQAIICSKSTKKLVKLRSKQLTCRTDFSFSDREDVEQDLMVYLVQRLPEFNPVRASANTFVSRIIDSGVQQMLRQRLQAKRCMGRSVSVDSLEELVESQAEVPTKRSELITSDDLDRRRLRQTRDAGATLELNEEVEMAISSLPDELQTLCRLLQAQSQTAIAQSTGVSRWHIQRRVKLIQKHFKSRGLNFLEFPAQVSKKKHT